MVINNEEILDRMQPYIYKFAELFEYLFGYAWLRFYLEESIKKTWVKTTDMFIFDINTASKLPVFRLDQENPNKNPYMPIMISKNSLIPLENIGGVEVNYNTFNPSHRICNLKEFKYRMNIFTTYDSTNDLFDGIDFKKNKMAICGSIMAACIQYSQPLMDLLFD